MIYKEITQAVIDSAAFASDPAYNGANLWAQSSQQYVDSFFTHLHIHTDLTREQRQQACSALLEAFETAAKVQAEPLFSFEFPDVGTYNFSERGFTFVPVRPEVKFGKLLSALDDKYSFNISQPTAE